VATCLRWCASRPPRRGTRPLQHAARRPASRWGPTGWRWPARSARGSGSARPRRTLVALVAATAIGVAWARAASWSAPILVRRADRELGLGGEFVAAVEEEQRDPGGPFARLGAHRLFGRVRPHDLREAAQPHTIGFAAAPLAGIVVVALAASAAADRARETRPPGGALAFLAGEELGRALTKARGEPGLDAELAEALADAAYEARNLGAAAEATRHRGAGATEDLNGTSRAAGDLARTVDQLSRELAGAPETVQAALRRAAAALDTLAFGAAGGRSVAHRRRRGAGGGRRARGRPARAPTGERRRPRGERAGRKRGRRGWRSVVPWRRNRDCALFRRHNGRLGTGRSGAEGGHAAPHGRRRRRGDGCGDRGGHSGVPARPRGRRCAARRGRDRLRAPVAPALRRARRALERT
jgi:hypothetical protein